MKIRPLRDNVVVRRDEAKKKTEGGIVLPDQAQVKTTRGTVLEVGPGQWSDELACCRNMSVRVGDRVAFDRYGGTQIDPDDELLIVLPEDQIVCVLEDDDAKRK